MKVGILEAGKIPPALQPEPRYAQPFIELLSPADADLEFHAYAAIDGELPESVDAREAYIITGGPAGVYDEDDWIPPLREFAVAVAEAGIKQVGVCFGHQLLADALGGKAVKSPKGRGIGVHRHRVAQTRAWMDPAKSELDCIVFHQDQVVALPPGAELLAESDFCPNAMFQLGDEILALQPHPEIEPPFAEKLLRLRREVYGQAATDAALLSLARERDAALYARWIANFLRA